MLCFRGLNGFHLLERFSSLVSVLFYFNDGKFGELKGREEGSGAAGDMERKPPRGHGARSGARIHLGRLGAEPGAEAEGRW